MSSSFSFSLILCFIVTILHCLSLSFAQSPIPLDQNVLQKHVAFFDRNHDGIIYPKETFEGFRALGFGITLSTVAASFINIRLSQITRPGQSPSLKFPIEVKNIQLGKHTSDTGVYDTEGRFIASRFEELFSKNAKKNPNSFTFDELMEMVKSNRVPKDYRGWLTSFLEWKILHVLAKDKDDLLSKEGVRGVYDGSLFEQMEKKINDIVSI